MMTYWGNNKLINKGIQWVILGCLLTKEKIPHHTFILLINFQWKQTKRKEEKKKKERKKVFEIFY